MQNWSKLLIALDFLKIYSVLKEILIYFNVQAANAALI